MIPLVIRRYVRNEGHEPIRPGMVEVVFGGAHVKDDEASMSLRQCMAALV